MLLADGLADRWGLADCLEKGFSSCHCEAVSPGLQGALCHLVVGDASVRSERMALERVCWNGGVGTTTVSFSVFEAVTGGQDLLFH